MDTTAPVTTTVPVPDVPDVGWILSWGLAGIGAIGSYMSFSGWYRIGILAAMPWYLAGGLPLITDWFAFIVSKILFGPQPMSHVTRLYAGASLFFAIAMSAAANGAADTLTARKAAWITLHPHQPFATPWWAIAGVGVLAPIMVGIVVHLRACLNRDRAAEIKRLTDLAETTARAAANAAPETGNATTPETGNGHLPETGNDTTGNGDRETAPPPPDNTVSRGRQRSRRRGRPGARPAGPARILPPHPDLPATMAADSKINAVARWVTAYWAANAGQDPRIQDFNWLRPMKTEQLSEIRRAAIAAARAAGAEHGREAAR